MGSRSPTAGEKHPWNAHHTHGVSFTEGEGSEGLGRGAEERGWEQGKREKMKRKKSQR